MTTQKVRTVTKYISISNSGQVTEAETLKELAMLNASRYGDKVTITDDGERITWQRNEVQQPESWVSAQADKRNGYTVKEAETDAYRYLLKHYQYAFGVAVYSVEPMFL